MHASNFAVALLLVAAPAASATEVTPEPRPQTHMVPVAAPQIRAETQAAPARTERAHPHVAPSAQPLSRGTYVKLLLVLAIVVAVASVLP